MTPRSDLPTDPFRPRFPALPILAPEEARRSESERYGALFYLGAGGLVVLILLVAWFAASVWSLRDIWSHVYELHDRTRAEAERVQAAHALAHDPRMTQGQIWEILLRRDVPPLARYILAEQLTSELPAADPHGYAVAVVQSEGLPDWLRLLMLRPVALVATEGRRVDRLALESLLTSPNPRVALWARYALAAGPSGEALQASTLESASRNEAPDSELAKLLLQALRAPGRAERSQALAAATLWLRTHEPSAEPLWRDWTEQNGTLRPARADIK